MSSKIIAALATSIAGALAMTQAQASSGPVTYACTSSEDLAVQRNHSTARVSFAGRSYELQRRRSSIGDKYVSSKAALIIDGNAATFVAEDLLDLGTCTKAVPVASSR